MIVLEGDGLFQAYEHKTHDAEITAQAFKLAMCSNITIHSIFLLFIFDAIVLIIPHCKHIILLEKEVCCMNLDVNLSLTIPNCIYFHSM